MAFDCFFLCFLGRRKRELERAENVDCVSREFGLWILIG